MKISVFFDHILQAGEQTGKDLEELLADVRAAEIEAVEIRLEYLLAHEEVVEKLKQAGLAVSCIYEFYEMGLHDESEKARKHIEAAVRIGAGRVLVVPGFLRGFESKRMQKKMPEAQAIERFMSHNRKILRMKEGLTYISELGMEKGVLVTVEDFDDPNSPLSGMHGIRWFLKQVPQLRYTLDTGNYLYYGENVLEAYNLLMDRITHVHCKDRHTGDNASVEVGSGYIPFEEVIDCLKVQGYDGYLAIEHFDVANQAECMQRSAQALRKMLGK
ncbi:MAG: sugar phosphate isomerase/epimerase [Lachnospiraceae bacterium]|nr:sugar phosphate isomerase/epimerase [Lachnospiraceae bacterium]